MGNKLRKALCGLLACGMLAGLAPVSAGAAVSTPFYDVASTSWYNEAVVYVYANKLMSGVDGNFFGPDVDASRGQIVTILYRLAGEPSVTQTNAFADVPTTAYYSSAVSWANKEGIVSGYGNGVFLPDGAITREQMAIIFYRFADYQKYDVTRTKDLSVYSDNWQISSYAKDAVGWAVTTGLMNGTDSTTFNPTGLASRAVLAATLMRYCSLDSIKVPAGTVVAAKPTVIEETPVPAVPAPVVPVSSTMVSTTTLEGNTIQTPKMTFQWPVQGTVSSGYGARYIFGSTSFHRGIDIPAPLGVGIHAGAAGTVSFAGEQGSYGNLVVIDHGNGFQSYYGHNSKLLVAKGDVVQKNQVIAACGSTGRSTGNHCHFEVHYKGQVVNPMTYLPAKNDAPANKVAAVVTEAAEAPEMTQEALILAAIY